VHIRNTCFIDNDFNGFGVVQVYDNGYYEVDNNYGMTTSSSSWLTCEFLAYAERKPGQPSDVTCVDFDLDRSKGCMSTLVTEREQ